MNDSPDLAGGHRGPAEDLGEGRLRDGRRHRLPRRRGPRRSARAHPRRARAGRRMRQRQRRDRRGPPHLGGTVGADYVPALLERGRERAAAERLDVEFVEADAQDLPFEDGELRRRDVDLRRDVRPRPGEDRRGAAAGRQTRRPDRDGQLDAATAPSGRCSRRSPSTRRRRPESNRRCSGAPRSACASCSATGSRTCGSRRRLSRQPFRSADHYIEFFRTYFGPTQMAYERVGAGGRTGPHRRPARLPRGGEHRRRPRDGARSRVPARRRDSRLSAATARVRAWAATTRIAAPMKSTVRKTMPATGPPWPSP